ncbi:MAG: AlkZ family DNA glycosylase [Candidatus Dormibacteraeota bacterium]|uniref:AlkZ family DNA glycosylase n=1 Tax=Candidatus Amunia macphersoniae TaxID=3127014 RepID=A0A934KPA2_9BACT|nr:AlkZ family DNA glycosylase [Candidatus Dormibacteraeota bacterium]
MNIGADIIRARLRNQRLWPGPTATAHDVVGWFGAVQAQDHGGARWAVAQRANGLAGAVLDQALAEGTILRTHLLRPTWHLVTPADIRWLLRLTAPRIKAQMAHYHRESGLDDETFTRSNRALAAALKDGRQLTRPELGDVLQRAGINLGDTIALGRVMMRAELDGVVCSGGLRGRQHTYALLDERAPVVEGLHRDVALSELAGRYFASHGPATIKDFSWWSGLSIADAAAGADTAHPSLECLELGGDRYWLSRGHQTPARRPAVSAHLLPNWDEYTVAYADRRLLITDTHAEQLSSRNESVLNNVVVLDGRVVGTWKRVLHATTVLVNLNLFQPPTEEGSAAIDAAAAGYASFLGLRGEVALSD